ncbi:carbohydrate porin, partial [Pseudomonas aeruginosa]|uniref:carbohydrate porin n=1 Tax=Pseudomonas aeruginosa TaxID=287 RepID=UPI001E2C49C9
LPPRNRRSGWCCRAACNWLEKGYDFKLEYVGEAAANLDGGYDDDKTGRYTDQFALGVHMDLEKILGWKAAEFQFTVTERNGKNLS